MGFPTANLKIPVEIENGLYFGLADTKPSLVFVGAAETFGEIKQKVEVYILDFEGNLYDRELEVELIKKTRPSIKFKTKEELIEQMKEDEKMAREFFKSNK